VEAEIDFVGGLKQTPDARRARCPQVATEPLIFDTAPAGPGVANNSKLGAIVPIPFREIRIVETLAEDHARSCRRPGAGAADKCHNDYQEQRFRHAARVTRTHQVHVQKKLEFRGKFTLSPALSHRMGEGESSAVGRRIQPFWEPQETVLAV